MACLCGSFNCDCTIQCTCESYVCDCPLCRHLRKRIKACFECGRPNACQRCATENNITGDRCNCRFKMSDLCCRRPQILDAVSDVTRLSVTRIASGKDPSTSSDSNKSIVCQFRMDDINSSNSSDHQLQRTTCRHSELLSSNKHNSSALLAQNCTNGGTSVSEKNNSSHGDIANNSHISLQLVESEVTAASREHGNLPSSNLISASCNVGNNEKQSCLDTKSSHNKQIKRLKSRRSHNRASRNSEIDFPGGSRRSGESSSSVGEESAVSTSRILKKVSSHSLKIAQSRSAQSGSSSKGSSSGSSPEPLSSRSSSEHWSSDAFSERSSPVLFPEISSYRSLPELYSCRSFSKYCLAKSLP